MMQWTAREPQTSSSSGDMQPDMRASSVLPDSPSSTATHDKHWIRRAHRGAPREKGVGPHDVSVNTFPDNDQLAGAQHRLKLAARDPEFRKVLPGDDPMVSAEPRGEDWVEARHVNLRER